MKPLIIGMNNPISTRPGHELYPLPEGCSGNRLWRMLHNRTGATMRQYLESFESRNLVRAYSFDRLSARARAYEIVCELRGSGRTVVLLGGAVRDAFDYVLTDVKKERVGSSEWYGENAKALPPVLLHPQQSGGITWRQVPHPSGRNFWYNEPKNVQLVELLMEELYVEYRKTQLQAAG